MSECLWSETCDISGKFVVNRLYPEFEDFFVHTLGVGRPDAHMVVDELVKIGSQESVQLSRLRSALAALNSMLDRETAAPISDALVQSRIFPIRQLDGSVDAVSFSQDFIIPDNPPLAQRFSGKLRMLDFSVEEIHRLRPLIHWAGLEARYLSAVVQETSCVTSSAVFPVTSSSLDLKMKAHAMLRYDAPWKIMGTCVLTLV